MRKTLMASLFALLFTGCEVFNPEIRYPESNSKISAVLVIIEDSYIGRNPGAKSDLRMMTNMVSTVTDDIVVLKDGYATRKNVKEAITRACSNDTAIIFFTCHGDQERASRSDGNFEEDGKDEYMYLSDSSITDNELWDIFKNSTNKVFTIFNCCHSGTMFRTKKDAIVQQSFEPFKNMKSSSGLNLLSWSACSDDGYAVTSKDGGEFVSSIFRTFNAFGGNVTYGQAWTTISNSKDLRKYQKPIVNVIGDYGRFENVPMFR